jgi:hypothetical protein
MIKQYRDEPVLRQDQVKQTYDSARPLPLALSSGRGLVYRWDGLNRMSHDSGDGDGDDETSVVFKQLTRLRAQEDFIK